MIAERDMVVVVGRPLTTVDIARLEEDQRAAAKAAARETNAPPPKTSGRVAGAAEGKAAPAKKKH